MSMDEVLDDDDELQRELDGMHQLLRSLRLNAIEFTLQLPELNRAKASA